MSKALVTVDRNLPQVSLKKGADGVFETAESFGIEAIINGKTGMFSVIIPRQSKVPVSRKKKYFPISDYQREIKVKCFKGERDLVADNIKLGEFVVSGLLPRLKKDAQGIEITFTINDLGVILVDAVELENPDNHLKVKLEYVDPKESLAKGVAKGILREVVGMFLPSGKK